MNIGKAIGKAADDAAYAIDNNLLCNSTGIGIEAEIENVRYRLLDRPVAVDIADFTKDAGVTLSPMSLWSIVRDGSLRNGVEFITSGPMFGINIKRALDQLQNFYDNYRIDNSPATSSERCSVHIHMDVRGFNKDQLVNIIRIYILLEKVLFTYNNPSRLKNNYCSPLTESTFKYTFTHAIRDLGSYTETDLLNNIKRHFTKYSALNILPSTSYGSIEFRHHQGTTDTTSIYNWINILLAVKRFSLAVDASNIVQMHNELGSDAFLSNIFGNTALDISSPDIHYLLLSGINDLMETYSVGDTRGENIPRAKAKRGETLIELFAKKAA